MRKQPKPNSSKFHLKEIERHRAKQRTHLSRKKGLNRPPVLHNLCAGVQAYVRFRTNWQFGMWASLRRLISDVNHEQKTKRDEKKFILYEIQNRNPRPRKPVYFRFKPVKNEYEQLYGSLFRIYVSLFNVVHGKCGFNIRLVYS